MTTETTSAPAESAPMTREAAVEAIKAMDTPQPVEKAPEPAAAPEEDPESEALPEAEDEADQPDAAIGDEEVDDGDQDDVPAIAAPRSWAAKEREVFDALPEEAKTIILAREDTRDRAVSKAQKEASDARKAASSEQEALSKLRPQLEGLVERAGKMFADKWDGVTDAHWQQWMDEDPTATMKLRFQFDAEKAEIGKLQTASDDQRKAGIQKFVADEMAKLSEIAPELVDPVKGQARRQNLAKFLIDNGVATYEQLPNISAKEMGIAYDAYRYRQLKAAPPKPKPTSATPAVTAPVRPAAAPSRSPSNDLNRAKNRFAQTGSREDAVEVIKRLGL